MCLKKQNKTIEFLSPTLKTKQDNHESEKTTTDMGEKNPTYNNNFQPFWSKF